MKNFNLLSIVGCIIALLYFTSCQKEDSDFFNENQKISNNQFTPPLSSAESDPSWVQTQTSGNCIFH